jgi:hypothetical protein
MPRKPTAPRRKGTTTGVASPRKVPAQAALPPALGPAQALSDMTDVILDPGTGAIVGAHRVVTFAGGKPGTDPAGAADALEILPAMRPKLLTLRHDGAVPAGETLVVRMTGGRPALKREKVAASPPKPIASRRG